MNAIVFPYFILKLCTFTQACAKYQKNKEICTYSKYRGITIYEKQIEKKKKRNTNFMCTYLLFDIYIFFLFHRYTCIYMYTYFPLWLCFYGKLYELPGSCSTQCPIEDLKNSWHSECYGMLHTSFSYQIKRKIKKKKIIHMKLL